MASSLNGHQPTPVAVSLSYLVIAYNSVYLFPLGTPWDVNNDPIWFDNQHTGFY